MILIDIIFQNVCYHVLNVSLRVFYFYFWMSFYYNYFNTIQLWIDLTIHFVSHFWTTADYCLRIPWNFIFTKIILYLLKSAISPSFWKMLGIFSQFVYIYLTLGHISSSIHFFLFIFSCWIPRLFYLSLAKDVG